MELITLTKIAVDSSLVILAILVQRIIYPSFSKIDRASFLDWHSSYTSEIGRIVAPLMISQLALSMYSLWTSNFSLPSLIVFVLVLYTWLDTFLRAVPLHAKLQEVNGLEAQITLSNKLVKVNLPRTFVWIAIFLVELIEYQITI